MKETKDLNSTFVVNCILNAFLSFTATALNIITLKALRKTSPLLKPLKTLLLSMTFSDLGVGLLVQPLYITVLAQCADYKVVTSHTCKSALNNIWNTSFFIAVNLFSTASFLSIIALTLDRFLAIHLHLRYQELVTHKRVIIAVILIWVYSALVCVSLLITEKVRVIIYTILELLFVITTSLLYCKIYATIRRHRNQIQVQQGIQAEQNGELTDRARQRKTAVGTFYVYILFLICYVPFFCIHVASVVYIESTVLSDLLCYAMTLIFLNSSLNPVIYCWKIRHIRQAVFDIARNIIPSRFY